MSLDLSAADIEAALAPLRTAKSMPAQTYTSAAIFAAERERIFLRHWFFLCREDQVPNIGDYRTFETQGGPIFVVRGQDGRVRCFANFCRHRGSLLVKGAGNCGARLTCPYHAWSIRLDQAVFGVHFRSALTKVFAISIGSIRISYALSNAIERNVNAGGAHGPSPLSGLAI